MSVGVDYRGLRMCEPCWNGVHFKRVVKPRKIICVCESSYCQCPCSKMQADASAMRKMQRDKSAANADAQQAFPDPGGIPNNDPWPGVGVAAGAAKPITDPPRELRRKAGRDAARLRGA